MFSKPIQGLFVILFAFPSPALAAPLPKPRPEQMRRELDALWTDLLSADELIAGRAVLKLAGWQDKAVDYLKAKLRPLKLDKQRAKLLIAELGSQNEKMARTAFEELKYFDPRLALTDKELRKALLDGPESCRLGAILADLPMTALVLGTWHWYSPDNQVYRISYTERVGNRDVSWEWKIAITVANIGKFGRNPNWVRATRAIAVLEDVGSDEATAILKDMATGHPDASPTKAVKAVLQRMKLQ